MLGGMEMSVTNEFRKAVIDKNVDGLRIMMSNSLLCDPTFEEFDEMERLAKDVPGLYVEYDGRPLENDSGKWNDNYLHRLDAELVLNFSHERIVHIKKVIQYLRPVKMAEMPQGNKRNEEKDNQKKRSYQEQKRQDQLDGRIIKIVSGAAVGGIAGGVISGVAGSSVITGVDVGAVIVGGVAVLATNK